MKLPALPKFLPFLAALAVTTAHGASIDRYREFLDGTRSARAAFDQQVYDRDGKEVQQSKGSFVFQRPGKFRWVYDKPADQVIVGDGKRVWIYDRQLNQVTVRNMQAALGSTPRFASSASGMKRRCWRAKRDFVTENRCRTWPSGSGSARFWCFPASRWAPMSPW